MFSQSNKPCYVSANFLYSVPPRVLGERLFMNGTRTGSQTKTLPIPFRRGKKLIPPTQREEIEHDLKAKKKLRQETGSCVNAWRRPAEFFCGGEVGQSFSFENMLFGNYLVEFDG